MRKVILAILVIICVCILTIWAVNRYTSDSVASTASANNAVVSSDTSKIEALAGKTEVVIGSGSGTAEATVMIPISVKTVPEKGIGSCNFNIKYDTETLEVVEVLPGDAIGSKASNLDYSIINVTGMVNFLFTSSNNGEDSITAPGVISNIKFKIKKDAKKGITKVERGTPGAFGDVSLNKINAVFTDGEITVN
ncbi:MAG: cohesin domain-containing protein [Ruminiclostridium sp.]